MTRGTIGPSSLLGGRYELVEKIGSGGMATVWRAVDGRLRRVVAVKVVSERFAGDVDFQRRFEREARHIARLSHPGIVTVHDVGVDDGRAFIVMELVEGSSLQRIVRQGEPLSTAEVVALALDVLPALRHAHERGIVHRDIKPGNILVTCEGVAKVADFGVATMAGETADLTLPGTVVGTAAYASPEQLAGKATGPPSDLYSLGCVLYQCLVGRPPFHDSDVARMVLQQRFADPEPVESARADVPERLSAAVGRVLAKDPGRRYATAQAMEDALAPVVGLADRGGLSKRLARGGGLPGVAPTGTPGCPAIGSASWTESKMAPMTSTTHVRPVLGDRRLAVESTDRSSRRLRRRATQVALLAALVVAGIVVGLVVTSGPPLGAHPATAGGNGNMPPGALLSSGHAVLSPNGRFGLAMDPDGNVVTYVVAGKVPTWESGTGGSRGAYAVMQSDGNFVVYPKGASAPAPGQPTRALWFSGTSGNAGASLWLLNDGNLEIRSRGAGRVLWRTGAVPGSVGSELLPGSQLHADQYLASPNGRYHLVDEPGRGVLRLFRTTGDRCTIWQRPANGHPVSYAAMQQNGDFVLYRPRPLTVEWQAGTGGNPGASLVLGNAGTLTLSSASGVTLWQAPASRANSVSAHCASVEHRR